MFDMKKLRREAAQRAVKLEIDRLAAQHDAMITSAVREDNRRTGNSIDIAMRRAKLPVERAVSRQTKLDRLSLFDHAEHNAPLAKILRALQKAGISV